MMGKLKKLIALLIFISAILFFHPGQSYAIDIYSITSIAAEDSVFQFSHEAGGSNRLLVVSIAMELNKPVQNITCAGLPLVRDSIKAYDSIGPRAEVWHLLNPPVGANQIRITITNGDKALVAIGAATYVGINQTVPFNRWKCDQAKSSSPHLNMVSDSFSLVQDLIASRSIGIPTASAGQTIIWNLEMGGAGQTGHYGAASTMRGQISTNLV